MHQAAIVTCLAYSFLILVASIYQYGMIPTRIEYNMANCSMGYWNVNLKPAQSAEILFLQDSSTLLRNLYIYFPLGVLTALAFLRSKTLLFSLPLLFITGKEALQFASMTGVFDINDILLNASGAYAGEITAILLNQAVRLIYNIPKHTTRNTL